MNNASQTKPLSGKRVFLYFLLFFGISAAVNGVMIHEALHTMSGLVTDHPYERGIEYNKVVREEQAQEGLGWKEEIELRNGQLHVALFDKSGKALTITHAVAKFTRPTEQGFDFEVPLNGSDTPVKFPLKGVWDVHVFATVGAQDYQQSKRLIVP